MKKIELEQWEPFPGDPRRMQYAGQRVAQEVFEELKHRLESMGYLPDEYFLMDREWENGREIPKDADIFCTTDYGGNEGVYLDVYLKWYEDSRPVTKSFITGKTLGETGADLDRMFLISSAITKAFHGDGETYALWNSCGCNSISKGCDTGWNGMGTSNTRHTAVAGLDPSGRNRSYPSSRARKGESCDGGKRPADKRQRPPNPG